MPLRMFTARLRRRRAEADAAWRLATRDAELVRREASLTQDQAHAEAVARLIAQGRGHAA